MSTSKQFFHYGFLALAISLASACGDSKKHGSGDNPDPQSPAPSVTRTGVLTDSAISGVQYSSSPSGLSGTTDINGQFQYRDGDRVTFTVAGVALPAVAALERMTPTTLAEALFAGDETKIGNATINLAILFQSLDDDGVALNGINIRNDASLNAFTPATDLAQAPETFVLEGTRGGESGEISAIDPVEALSHYYRNELMGTWRASAVRETVVFGAEKPAESIDFELSDDVGFIFAFDGDESGRFIYGTWDTASETDEERTGDIAVGDVRYPEGEDDLVIRLDGTGSRVWSDAGSSTDPDEPLMHGDVSVKLKGSKLVITNVYEEDVDEDGEEDTVTAVFTLDRVNNSKDSLLGAWVEQHDHETGDGLVEDSFESGPVGALSFGYGVSGVLMVYLSDSLLAYFVTDIDDEQQEAGTGFGRNGLIVASYSRSGDSITVGNIKHDGVSTDASGPLLAGDDATYTHGPVAANGRTAVLNYVPGDADEAEEVTRFLSTAELAAFPVPMIGGYWAVTEETTTGCPAGSGAIQAEGYGLYFEDGQWWFAAGNGDDESGWIEDHLPGTLTGNSLAWEGTYGWASGSVEQRTTATVSGNGWQSRLSGTSTWTWTDGSNPENTCTGTTRFTGIPGEHST